MTIRLNYRIYISNTSYIALPLSQQFFNFYDWDNTNLETGRIEALSMANKINAMIYQEQKLKELSKRSKLQWRILYVKRFFGIVINLILVVLSGYAIVKTQTEKENISNFVMKFNWLNKSTKILIIDAAPGLVLSVVSAVVPAIVKITTKFEAYDFESDMIDQQILRIYLINIINVSILLLT